MIALAASRSHRAALKAARRHRGDVDIAVPIAELHHHSTRGPGNPPGSLPMLPADIGITAPTGGRDTKSAGYARHLRSMQVARREHRRAPTLGQGWTGRLSDIRHRAATDVPVAAELRGASVSTDFHSPALGSRVYMMQEGACSEAPLLPNAWALPMRDLGRLAAWDQRPDRTPTVRPDPGPPGPTAALFRARCWHHSSMPRGDLAADDFRERGDARGR